MIAADIYLDQCDKDFELAGKLLEKSIDRLKQLRALQSSFASGSPERMRANILLKEVEVLHHVLDQLCYQFRRSRVH